MLKTFPKGGVHPPENKLSADKAIKSIELPMSVIIPVSQHMGRPSEILVKRNDTVKTGQIIARSSAFVSANIHSPVSGKVKKIEDSMDTSGYRRQSILIDVDGDEWDESIDRTGDLKKEVSFSPKEIIDKIFQAGIVGLGGATFPSHVKLSIPEGKNVDTLIINGVECEPYLTADHRLMLEKGEEIMVGISIIMKALQINRAIIGIENNKKDAIEHFEKLAGNYGGIEVKALKVKYPQGGEKQLIKALINREVPSGKLPLEVGAVVHNVGTAFAVYEAVQKNKPLIERVVTVTGKSLSQPSNFWVRIGIPIQHVIEAAGDLPGDTGKVINGGPMMGKAVNTLDIPVTKGTSGILIMPENESKRRPVKPCIRCTKCVSICPMGLEPYLLMVYGQKHKHEEMEADHALDCMECGSCSYICPSDRPLLDYIRLGKAEVSKIIRERKQK